MPDWWEVISGANSSSFWGGIVSAGAISIILFLFRYFIGSMWSRISRLFTRSIGGRWKITYKQGSDECLEYAEVFQFLDKVWGTITNPVKGRKYNFYGKFHYDILVATYEVVGQHLIVDRGAFTLVLDPRGEVSTLRGKYAWTNDDLNNPKADDYTWEKI